MRTNDFLNSTKNFAYIEKRGKFYTFDKGSVYEIELVKAIFPISDTAPLQTEEKVRYEVKIDGGKRQKELCYEQIYTDKECLTRPHTSDIDKVYFMRELKRKGVGNKNENNIYSIQAWIFGKEGVKKITPEISKVEHVYGKLDLDIEFDEETCEYKKMYEDEQKCLSDQEFDIFDKEGNLKEHYVGINKRLAFDEKQTDIINRLNAVMDEAKANDIYIIMNLYNYELGVINTRHMKKQDDINKDRILLLKRSEKEVYNECDIVDLIKKATPIHYFGTDVNEDFCYAVTENAERNDR